jgi:hypothetical protein
MGNEATGSLPVRRVDFTYLDYLELRGWEFEKFRRMPPISDDEIEAVDWQELASRFAD